MKGAGIICDFSPHYLDHLAPFCALLGWPLIVSDPIIQESAEKYYPDVSVISCDALDLPNALAPFGRVVSCTPRLLLEEAAGPLSASIFLPHGQSDKGEVAPYFDALRQESVILAYGQKMADILKQNAIAEARIVRIGHFRKLFYRKTHKAPPSFFANKQPTVLYAPTWEDRENNSSFWASIETLSQKLPHHINLLVKPHPNTIAAHAPAIERLIGKIGRGNLRFLLDWPPIFPLLAGSDAYLGDRSSIGYDFLAFDRPLFFLSPHSNSKGRDLLRCGLSVTAENFFDCFLNEPPQRLSSMRQAMNAYAFDDIPIEIISRTLAGEAERRQNEDGGEAE